MPVVEREPKIPLRQVVRAELGFWGHQIAKFVVAEIPFTLRALRAPDGAMFRENRLIAYGKVVRYSGDSHVILTEKGEMVFPNPEAGDEIRVNKPKMGL